MKRLTSLISILLVASALLGCGDDKRVLATVNGEEITQEQFDAYLALKRIPHDDEKRREKAWAEYVDREGMTAVIEKEGKLDKSVIEAEVNEFRKELIISRYFDEFLSDAVDEKKVENAYGSEAAAHETKKVHVAHILVRTSKRMDEEQRKAKLTTAQEIHSKLQAGESFEEFARQFSEDKISGKRGGDLGWIKEGTIDERFSKRAFSLKVGTVTEPFETPFGFHILKVLEEPKTVRRPLGAVAGEIRYRLRAEAKEKELERIEKAVKVEKKDAYKPELAPKRKEEKVPTEPAPDSARGASVPGQPGALGGPPGQPGVPGGPPGQSDPSLAGADTPPRAPEPPSISPAARAEKPKAPPSDPVKAPSTPKPAPQAPVPAAPSPIPAPTAAP